MPEQDYTYDAFLSYTEVNKTIARKLYEQLRNVVVRVFFAEETILAVANVPLGVMDALQGSRKVAIIMTLAYFAKGADRRTATGGGISVSCYASPQLSLQGPTSIILRFY